RAARDRATSSRGGDRGNQCEPTGQIRIAHTFAGQEQPFSASRDLLRTPSWRSAATLIRHFPGSCVVTCQLQAVAFVRYRVTMSNQFRQHGQGMMNPDLLSDQAREQPDGADASIFGAKTTVLDDVDRARADEYALLASLLITPPDSGSLARLSDLSDNSDTPLGRAHIALAQAAASYSHDAICREYSDLFIGVGRGELLPYASYYLTGFLNERPLARLRADMARFGIERAEGHCEPEDHLASVCEMMSGFACDHFSVSHD